MPDEDADIESADSELWSTDTYKKVVKDYRKEVARALATSIIHQSIDGGPRRYWSSVIFLRILLISRTIHKILPDIDAERMRQWWDFASFANLVRSMFELLLFFRYFTEPCSDVEWDARLRIMQLSDNAERMRYFRTTGATDQIEIGSNREAELLAILEANPVIQAIEPKQRKQLLYGFRPSILAMRDIATKFGVPDSTWSNYQFLSSYTHSLPMSFYRTEEHGRYGTDNKIDRAYFVMHLDWITEILREGIDFYEKDMNKVKDKKKHQGEAMRE